MYCFIENTVAMEINQRDIISHVVCSLKLVCLLFSILAFNFYQKNFKKDYFCLSLLILITLFSAFFGIIDELVIFFKSPLKLFDTTVIFEVQP